MANVLTLGDPQIDSDHAELQRLIDNLADAVPGLLPKALSELHGHAAAHFAIEDIELREMKDGNAKCHIDEHGAVLASLREVESLITPDPATAASQTMVARLVVELRRWLPEHVMAMDAGVATYRTKRRLGGAPIVLSKKVAG